jgi:hypothetical protein
MTQQDALAEIKRRWPTSDLHNAYETVTTSFPGADGGVRTYHVVAYNPLQRGSGTSWDAAFADAEQGEKGQ